MCNVGNEYGQILNSVLTSAEGLGLEAMAQGIVKRYTQAGKAPPAALYVDRDCCSQDGSSAAGALFRPWVLKVRLDIWHFMRRFCPGLNTDAHPLYATFPSRLSGCIFEWDNADLERLREAKLRELLLLKRKNVSKKQISPSRKWLVTVVVGREVLWK